MVGIITPTRTSSGAKRCSAVSRRASPPSRSPASSASASVRSGRGCAGIAPRGKRACRVFQDARPTLKAYTLRKRREVFDEINALTWTLMQAQGVYTQDEADSIRRVAVHAWLQDHRVITITQNHRVLPVFLQKIAHN